jgi:ASCH domain
MQVPVLTFRQPWAGLVALGIKTLENRSWKPPAKLTLPFRLLVHAGLGTDPHDGERPEPACSARGVIGQVNVVGFIHPEPFDDGGYNIESSVPRLARQVPASMDQWWNEEDIGWLLQGARLFERVLPLKGKLGLWYLDEEALPPLKPSTRRR